MPHELFEDLNKVTNIVFGDAFRIAQLVEASPDNSWLGRSYIRSVFAAFEALTFGMQRMILKINELRQLKLNEDDLDKLKEVRGDPQGNAKKGFAPLSDNIKSTFKLFAKVHGFACPADFRGEGWRALLEAVPIRNRLMHPKSSRDLEVTVSDLAQLTQAFSWYFTTHNDLVEQAKLEIRKHAK